jgi:DNA-binding response OmpR family regulator
MRDAGGRSLAADVRLGARRRARSLLHGDRVAPEVRVLVVEDEARIAAFLVKGLTARGYKVESVATGAEGLARALEPDFDVVILDLGLPDIDGMEVLSQLRQEERWVSVLVMSARTGADDVARALRVGADEYLKKPFAFDELLARVRACLAGDDHRAKRVESADLRRLSPDAGGC